MNDEFFTSDKVDTQIEQLAERQDQPSAEALLLQDLRSLSTRDARVLTRARERLFSAGQLKLTQPVTPPTHVLDRPTLVLKKPRRSASIITTIAACLVAALLVGSLISFFALKQPLAGNNHTSVTPATEPAVPQPSFLYVNNGADGLHKVDPDSGRIIWHVTPEKYQLFTNSRLAIVNSTVFAFAGGPDTDIRYILSFDAGSGKFLKAVAIKPRMTKWSSMGSYLITDTTFYISINDGGDQSGKGHIDAFSLQDGSLRWSRQTIGTTFMSTPYKGNIYVAEANQVSHVSKLSALRVSDGAVQWQTQPENMPSGRLLIANDRLIVGQLVAGGADVYSAYDLTTHARLWRTDVFPCQASQYVYASLMAGRLYMSCPTGLVAAFTIQDGKRLWQKNTGNGLGDISSFMVAGDTLYVHQSKAAPYHGPSTDRMLALSIADGAQRWSQNLDASAGTPVFYNGKLYSCAFNLSAPNNRIQVRNISDGRLLNEYQLGPNYYAPELVLAP